jgi:hypothetical protein
MLCSNRKSRRELLSTSRPLGLPLNPLECDRYNLIPYQRRALNAGKCGVEVEGGVLPTSDWMTNLQILTSGGYRCALEPPNH